LRKRPSILVGLNGNGWDVWNYETAQSLILS
jgi:hypothetical protein